MSFQHHAFCFLKSNFNRRVGAGGDKPKLITTMKKLFLIVACATMVMGLNAQTLTLPNGEKAFRFDLLLKFKAICWQSYYKKVEYGRMK